MTNPLIDGAEVVIMPWAARDAHSSARHGVLAQ